MAVCPICSNGNSTGHPPIQVKIKKERAINQNDIWVRREKVIFLAGEIIENGKEAGRRMAENIAITPPNFLGIERRIV